MDSRQCQVCGEVFRQMNDIMSHISEHSKKDIYDCLVALKSSLEIFMKQYFALKKYVELNLNNEKCNGDDFSGAGNYDKPNVNSVDMGDNSCSIPTTQEVNLNSREITPNWDLKTNVSIDKQNHAGNTDNTLNLRTNGSDIEHNFDHREFRNSDETSNFKRIASQREHNPPRSSNNYQAPSLNRNVSQRLKNHLVEKIPCQENIDTLRNAEFQKNIATEITRNHGNISKDNFDKDCCIDLTDVVIKEECIDEDLTSSTTNLNSVEMGDNSLSNQGTQEINSNSSETIPISENGRMEKNGPVSIIDLSHGNLQKRTELIDNTREIVVREINENIQNRVLNTTATTCLECGRIFSTKFVLRRHMMSHTGERTHACPICGKGFIGKQNMMVHLRVHTGERPYKCPYCGQHFSQYGTLYRHKKRHMAANDVKLMNCTA